jgi:uncharacterized membrane-anchored protein YjiN (DUF445 family)
LLTTDIILQSVTQNFVKSKVLEAIENSNLKTSFKEVLKKVFYNQLNKLFDELLRDLEIQKQSYEKAYNELIEQMKKKQREFYEYIEKLKTVRAKLKLCGGVQ